LCQDVRHGYLQLMTSQLFIACTTLHVAVPANYNATASHATACLSSIGQIIALDKGVPLVNTFVLGNLCKYHQNSYTHTGIAKNYIL